MNRPTLRANLAEAWLAKAHAAEVVLRSAALAPALFRPEFVAQRQADWQAHWGHYAYWNSQGA